MGYFLFCFCSSYIPRYFFVIPGNKLREHLRLNSTGVQFASGGGYCYYTITGTKSQMNFVLIYRGQFTQNTFSVMKHSPSSCFKPLQFYLFVEHKERYLEVCVSRSESRSDLNFRNS